MSSELISKATIERLPLYLNYLHEIEEEKEYISSAAIAKELSLGEVLVRKDLASVSDKGKPKHGYLVSDLISDITGYLNCNNVTPAVIVGAGKIGRAILAYPGFHRYGIDILAAFGHHANQEIALQAPKPILELSEFESFVKEHNVKIGIITVPVAYAQEVCDMMVSCGIKGIWNFARKTLNVPSDVIVQQEDLAASAAILSCKLKNMD